MRGTALSLVLLQFALFACEPQYRQCPITHTDPIKQLYNDVLIEIVEKQLYPYAYLPDEDQKYIYRHFKEVYPHDIRESEYSETDSNWLRRQGVLFHNKLFNDTTRFKTYYLNRSTSVHLTGPLMDPIRFSELNRAELRTWLKVVAPGQEQAALDSLYEPQTFMKAGEFNLCTFRLQPFPEATHLVSRHQRKITHSTITLSKAYVNSNQNKAIIGFSLAYADGFDGYAKLLLVEKKNGRWRISQDLITWET